MSNGIVEALDQAVKRVAKAMGEDAGKAVEKLYRDTGGKLKDAVERTVEWVRFFLSDVPARDHAAGAYSRR